VASVQHTQQVHIGNARGVVVVVVVVLHSCCTLFVRNIVVAFQYVRSMPALCAS
jgi:hypothetical protein